MEASKLEVRALSKLFRALGDETRLRIVALLSHGELCVCHVEEALGLTQPTASRHLGVLRAAGVVQPRREGTWVYYALVPQPDEECERQLQHLVTTFRKKNISRRDILRLVRIRGPESCR
jgi:ArsR family transcriptional regulator